jgi:hypothetical protein
MSQTLAMIKPVSSRPRFRLQIAIQRKLYVSVEGGKCQATLALITREWIYSAFGDEIQSYIGFRQQPRIFEELLGGFSVFWQPLKHSSL